MNALTTLIAAAAASGLTLGAAADQPEFATSPYKVVATGSGGPATNCGTETLTQSLDQSLVPGTVACSPDAGATTTENSFIRFYDIGASGFDICGVDFGIESATGPGGTQSVDVNLYTLPPLSEPIFVNFVPLASVTVDVPDQALTIFSASISATALANSTVVVEIFSPDQTGVGSFFAGSNNLGETADSYIASASCSLGEPTPYAAIGFPNVDLLLNLVGGPAPDGDTCEDCIRVGDGDTTGDTNDNTASSPDNINSCGSDTGSPDAWFCYTATDTGIATASTCNGTAFDTILTVYEDCEGTCEIDCNDDSCGLQSEVTWAAVAGQTYYVRISGFLGAQGAYTLTLSCTADALGACCELDGSCTDLASLADCDASAGLYQGDGTNCACLVCPETTGACCLDDNTCLDGLTEAECVAEPGTYQGGGSVCLGDSNNDGADDLCLPPPPVNDDCENRIPIFDGPTPFSTVGATTDGEPGTGCQFGGQTFADIWYNYTATCDGILTVTTCEGLGGSADYDTDLVIYEGTDCNALGDPPLGCNDDGPSADCPSFHSVIEVEVAAGQEYKIRVGGFNSDANQGTGVLNIVCSAGIPTGACCEADETCTPDITQSECKAGGGIYQGDGSLCDPPDLCVVLGCGDIGTLGCCKPNGTPFCDDLTCCKTVCAIDPFCCDTSWDAACAGEALTSCPALCGEPTGACCFADESCLPLEQADCKLQGGIYQGNNEPCDPNPCLIAPACGDAGTGDCCVDNGPGSPFCDNADCCNTVCALDPFCCNVTWDGLCAGEAETNCGALCAVDVGACCADDGSCFETSEATCVATSGSYQGDGSVCSPLQACCFADESCMMLDPLCCGDQGGIPQGSGSTCDPNPCIPVDNDECEGRTFVFDGENDIDLTGATQSEPDSPSCDFPFGDIGGFFQDRWYNYISTCKGTLFIDTCGGADIDTRLAVYDTKCECPNPATFPDPVACNDDHGKGNGVMCDGTFESSVSLDVEAGQCLKIRVGTFSAGTTTGPDILNIEIVPNADGKSELVLGSDTGNGYVIGERVEVTVTLDSCTIPAAGFQGFIEYDSDELNFNGVTYTTDPFGLHIINNGNPLLNPVPGEIALASGIDQDNLGQNPVTGSFLLATMNFTAKLDGCIPPVEWRDNVPPTTVTDRGGTPVEVNLIVDPSPAQCLGDTNGDGQVNVTDLINVIQAWGTDSCTANVDGLCEDPPIGCVNVLDLVAVITNWGPCP